MPVYEGKLEAKNLKFAVVVSRFNASITEAMLATALDAFSECGANEKELEIVWVPGVFEIPIIAKRLAESKKYDAIMAIGCLIRGETIHFDLVATSCADAIQVAACQSLVPIIFSVIATTSLVQAEERIDIGRRGALSAIEMASLNKILG